jgi:hypothetical protein
MPEHCKRLPGKLRNSKRLFETLGIANTWNSCKVFTTDHRDVEDRSLATLSGRNKTADPMVSRNDAAPSSPM